MSQTRSSSRLSSFFSFNSNSKCSKRHTLNSFYSNGSVTSHGSMTITGVVGGYTNGVERFSDIELIHGGDALLDDRRQNSLLNRDNPIRHIKVYCRNHRVVGMEVTYQLIDGTHVTLVRGTSGDVVGEVHLKPNERLSVVYGRAGLERNTNCESVYFIGFVLGDLNTGHVRTVGPFPNGANREDGVPFHVHNVLAFGGYERANDRMLTGLYFYSDAGMMMSRRPPITLS